MNKRTSRHIIIAGFAFMLSFFQLQFSNAQSPKIEIRAVWVATVSNLDWPIGSERYTKEAQQEQMISILDSMVTWNLNAMFLQIRPQSDAFYQSTIVPWSEYVSGSRGTSPGYDPLQFTIEEAHKRGIEVHGWLNPYRYETSMYENDGKPNGVYTNNQDWLLYYTDKRILNPGEPEVIQHIKDVVGEIINNYDIDGIHFDDYFYPYSGTSNQDIDTYNTYGGGFANIGDWRRDNVNQMVADVMDTIMQVNPHVRFGISPFGIYTQYVPEGIAASLDAYNTLYIDPIQWLSSGSIDYLNPQLYWHIGSSWDYSLLLPWWAEQALTYNRHLIAGHAIYKLVLDPSARIAEYDLHEYKDYFNFTESEARLQERTWLSLSEISNQIDIVRENRDQNAMGSAFFRYQDFIVVDGLAEHIVTHNYNNPATLPPMTWKSAIIPDPPNNIRWDVDGQGASFITWDVANDNDRYVLYASSEPSPPAGFIDDPANIVKILYDNTFYLEGSEITGKPNLFFTTYDRYGNESATATMFAIDAPSTASTLQTPINLAVNQAFNFDFSWTSVDQAQSYLLEVSSTSDFQSIEFSTSVAAITFNASEFALLGEQEYYWRITPLNAAGSGPGSDVFSFTSGFPANAVITAPADGEQYVDLSPLVQWGTNTVATSVKLQIAKGGSQFLEYNIIIDKDLGAVGEYQLTETLTEWTTHYMRIKLINSLGESHWTYSDFKTLMIVPAAPIIYAPDQDQNFEPSDPVEIKWGKTSKATGYQIDLSTDIDRTNVIESDKKYSYSDTTIVYNNLLEGEYYANVAGTNIGGTGAWSQVKFIIEHVVGINDKELDNKRLSVSYLNKSELILGIDATGLKIYNLKMYDLYGHELVLPESAKQGAIENYVLNRNILPPFSIVILESTEGVEYVKIIGR